MTKLPSAPAELINQSTVQAKGVRRGGNLRASGSFAFKAELHCGGVHDRLTRPTLASPAPAPLLPLPASRLGWVRLNEKVWVLPQVRRPRPLDHAAPYVPRPPLLFFFLSTSCTLSAHRGWRPDCAFDRSSEACRASIMAEASGARRYAAHVRCVAAGVRAPPSGHRRMGHCSVVSLSQAACAVRRGVSSSCKTSSAFLRFLQLCDNSACLNCCRTSEVR